MTAEVSTEILRAEPADDLRTSRLGERLIEWEGGVLAYSPVIHDRPVRDRKLKFGRRLMTEPMSVSAENAVVILASVYGFDAAEGLVARALTGDGIVNAPQFENRDTTARTKGSYSLARDKSRTGDAVSLWVVIFKQSGGKR